MKTSAKFIIMIFMTIIFGKICFACNGPPTAVISSPSDSVQCFGYSSFYFNGSNSEAYGGRYIINYYWATYQEGVQDPVHTQDGDAYYTFTPPEPGNYTVRLWVTDNENYESVNDEYRIVSAVQINGGLYSDFDAAPVGRTINFYLDSTPSAGSLVTWRIDGITIEPFPNSNHVWWYWDDKGPHTVSVSGCGNTWVKDVIIFEFDLDVEGLTGEFQEELEESPGKYIGANNDDDDGNKRADYADIEVLPIDDELVEIYLKIDPMQNSGVIRLIAVWNDTQNPCPIKVWSNHTKGIQLTLPYEWDLSQGPPPSKLYVEGVRGGDVNLELWYDQFHLLYDTVTFHVINIEIPFDYSGNGLIDDGGEEFTFTSSIPGILTFNCRATNSSNLDMDYYRWTLSIGSQPGQWYPHITANQNIGQGRISTFTFTGLPSSNNAFGRARIYLSYNYGGISFTVVRDIEVFFPRDAIHFSGGVQPNWYFYWSQVYCASDMQYVSEAVLGRTVGITAWRYIAPQDKDRIEIGNAHPTQGRSYGVGEFFSGIDRFIGTVIHEEKHVDQIARADPLVPTNGSDSFRYGWSWNSLIYGEPHNHWTKGPDGQWGQAGVDDDGDGIIDNAKTTPPFEPGNGDDVSLEHPNFSDWPNSW